MLGLRNLPTLLVLLLLGAEAGDCEASSLAVALAAGAGFWLLSGGVALLLDGLRWC